MRCHWQMVGGHHIDTEMGVAGIWGNAAAEVANHHSLGSQGSSAKCQNGPLVTLGDLLHFFIWGGLGPLCHHPRRQATENLGFFTL